MGPGGLVDPMTGGGNLLSLRALSGVVTRATSSAMTGVRSSGRLRGDVAQEARGDDAPTHGEDQRQDDERSEHDRYIHAWHRRMRAAHSLGPNGTPFWDFQDCRAASGCLTVVLTK